MTARDIIMGIRKINLWDHEGILDDKEIRFSYNKIYPGIYEKIENKNLREGR